MGKRSHKYFINTNLGYSSIEIHENKIFNVIKKYIRCSANRQRYKISRIRCVLAERTK